MKEMVPKKGINGFQLKCLGIIFMTLDHIGEAVSSNMETHPLRLVGRIAAPLFLYMIVNGTYHTRSKLKFALRLYIAHILICLATLFLTTVWQDKFGVHDQFSILSTFAYVVLLIWLIEKMSDSVKKAVVRNFLFLILAIGVIGLSAILLFLLSGFEIIYQVFLPNILLVPYSPIFILMGVCWYFMRDKKKQMLVLVFFSCLSLIGAEVVNRSSVWVFLGFFNTSQFWMIFLLPLIYLYNGEKGKSMKYFFYVYYPVHVFILMFIGQRLA